MREQADSDRRPEVLSAAEWGASSPRAPLGRLLSVDHLVLHHTAYAMERIGGATVAAESRHMRQIERWHFDRGFLAIGYHFVISPSGRVFRGRPIDRIGAHVKGHNARTLGICLMGDFEHERATAAALAALAFVRTRLVPGGAALPLRGHRDHARQATACPGRFLVQELRKRERPPDSGLSRTDA